MPELPLTDLILFACLPEDVTAHLAISNDLGPARSGRSLVAPGRRHIALLHLGAEGVAEAYVIALVNWVMATMPPFAFRVLFDRLIVSPRSALLKASERLAGAEAAQAHLVEALRHYGLPLSRQAVPQPHVTLGYGYREPCGTLPIDGIGWQVEELVLVRSHHGRTLHEHLAHWRLPHRLARAA
jgi:2'-5' RNA ligase